MTRAIKVLSYTMAAGFLAWLGFHLIGMPLAGIWSLFVAMTAWLALMALAIGLAVADLAASLRRSVD
jgi:hypothetical protein